MSYFKLSTGENPVTNGDFSTGAGDFAPIPKGQVVKAAVTSLKWDQHQDNPEVLSLEWVIGAPQKYRNRKIFQKIKLNDQSTETKDKAIRMLGAIYTNAGGDISKFTGKPTEAQLISDLANKFMLLELGVWELEDKSKSGNFVSRVSPVNNADQAAKVENIVGQEKPKLQYDPAQSAELDQDLPF